MFTRLSFSPLVFAAAMLGCSGIAFAQSQPAPAAYDLPPAPPNPNGPAGAQGRMQSGGQHMRAGRRPNRMRMAIRSLGLSSEQNARIKSMMRGFRQSRLAGSPVPRRQMIAQIEQMLTPAQRQRFEARMQRRGQVGGGPNGMGGFRGQQGQDGPQNGPGMGEQQGPGYGGGPQGPYNGGEQQQGAAGGGAPSV